MTRKNNIKEVKKMEKLVKKKIITLKANLRRSGIAVTDANEMLLPGKYILIGQITEISIPLTKKGSKYVKINLADDTGEVLYICYFQFNNSANIFKLKKNDIIAVSLDYDGKFKNGKDHTENKVIDAS